jgi:hypothetical protein
VSCSVACLSLSLSLRRTTDAGAEVSRSRLLSTTSVLVSTSDRRSGSNDGYVVPSNRHILMSELANLATLT